MWWLWNNNTDHRMENAFSAFGAYGQSITVYPEIDAVVVFNTKPEYGRSNNVRVTQILPKRMIEIYKPEEFK